MKRTTRRIFGRITSMHETRFWSVWLAQPGPGMHCGSILFFVVDLISFVLRAKFERWIGTESGRRSVFNFLVMKGSEKVTQCNTVKMHSCSEPKKKKTYFRQSQHRQGFQFSSPVHRNQFGEIKQSILWKSPSGIWNNRLCFVSVWCCRCGLSDVSVQVVFKPEKLSSRFGGPKAINRRN